VWAGASELAAYGVEGPAACPRLLRGVFGEARLAVTPYLGGALTSALGEFFGAGFGGLHGFDEDGAEVVRFEAF